MKSFRIKAETGHYFTVNVFPKMKEMYTWYKKFSDETGRPREKKPAFAGCVMGYEKINCRGKRLKDMGYVLLVESHLDPSVTSHEMIHCSAHYIRIKRGTDELSLGDTFQNGGMELEEEFAYAHTQFMDELAKNLLKHKYWR